MRTRAFLLMCCLALLLAAPTFADLVLTDNGAAGFISMPAPTATGNGGADVSDPNQSPTAYWDHQSEDASPSGACDIGYIVNKTFTGSGCSNINGSPLGADDPASLSYWGLTGANGTKAGNYDPNVGFSNATSQTVEFETSLTGFGSGDTFGWFDYANGDTNPAVLHPLFTAGAASETVVTMPANDVFGFYLTNGNGMTYQTFSFDSKGNLNNQIQHFALFANDTAGCTSQTTGNGCVTNNFYLGAEDFGSTGISGDGTGGLKSDFDYNDILVHISTVPEPGSLPILVSGLAGMLLLLRRRSQVTK